MRRDTVLLPESLSVQPGLLSVCSFGDPSPRVLSRICHSQYMLVKENTISRLRLYYIILANAIKYFYFFYKY
jgi:hypothetical protein